MKFIHVVLGLATAFMTVPVVLFGAIVVFYFVMPSNSVESIEAFWFSVLMFGSSLIILLLAGAGLVASIVGKNRAKST